MMGISQSHIVCQDTRRSFLPWQAFLPVMNIWVYHSSYLTWILQLQYNNRAVLYSSSHNFHKQTNILFRYVLFRMAYLLAELI